MVKIVAGAASKRRRGCDEAGSWGNQKFQMRVEVHSDLQSRHLATPEFQKRRSSYTVFLS